MELGCSPQQKKPGPKNIEPSSPCIVPGAHPRVAQRRRFGSDGVSSTTSAAAASIASSSATRPPTSRPSLSQLLLEPVQFDKHPSSSSLSENPTTEDPIPAGSLLYRFVHDDDAFRNQRFKIVNRIVKGPWIIEKTAGNCSACLLGKALTCKKQNGIPKNFIDSLLERLKQSLSVALVHSYPPPAEERWAATWLGDSSKSEPMMSFPFPATSTSQNASVGGGGGGEFDSALAARVLRRQ